MLIYLSAFTYIIIYGLAIAFFRIGESDSGRSRQSKVFIALSILLICLFSAMRNYSVGTDTINYFNIYTILESYQNWSEVVQYHTITGFELGFCGYAYIIGHVVHNFRVYLFVTQLIIISPIYYLAHKNKEYVSPANVLFVYLFIFNNMSYNATRQFIAVAFLLWAYTFLINKKYIRSVALFILAILFHQSAIVGIGLIVLAVVYTRHNSRRNVLLCILAILIAIVIQNKNVINGIINMLVNAGIINSTKGGAFARVFTGALSTESNLYSEKNTKFYILIFFKFLLWLTPFLYTKLRSRALNIYENISGWIVLFGVIIYGLGSIAMSSIHIYRMTIYFEMFYYGYFSIMMGKGSLQRRKTSALVMNLNTLIINILVFAYWYFVYFSLGHHSTYLLF